MTKSKKTVIKMATYENHDMIYVFINKECVFQGNTHDYHVGCHGPVIGGYNLEGLWDTGAQSLCGVLKLLMEKEGKVVELKEEKLTDRQYMKLGGYL